MPADTQALPVVPGYDYALRMTVTGPAPVVPAGCQLRSQLRHYVGAPGILAELTTENGGLTRINDDTIDFRIPAQSSAAIKHDAVVIDFVRTDLEPDVYLYVLLSIPVLKPVTRRS